VALARPATLLQVAAVARAAAGGALVRAPAGGRGGRGHAGAAATGGAPVRAAAAGQGGLAGRL